MDAVGYVCDRHVVNRNLGPVPLPHGTADTCMKPAHTVVVSGYPEGEKTHVERFEIVFRVSPAQCEEVFLVQPQPIIIMGEIAVDQIGFEYIDSCRNRGMSGENTAGAYCDESFIEREFLLFDQFPDSPDSAESGVPLVHVDSTGIDSQGCEGFYPPNTDHYFLLDAHFLVATVELVCDRPVVGAVIRNVGIEQVERHPAHLDLPDAGEYFAAGEIHPDQKGVVVIFRAHQTDRHFERIAIGIRLLLVTVDIQILAEITVLVHQAHTHDWNAEITGAFHMVSGQYPQPTRVSWNAFCNSELGAEIGYVEMLRKIPMCFAEPCFFLVDIFTHHLIYPVQMRQETIIRCQSFQRFLIDGLKDQHGVVTARFPELRVHAAEKFQYLHVPAPVKVRGQITKALQLFRQ